MTLSDFHPTQRSRTLIDTLGTVKEGCNDVVYGVKLVSNQLGMDTIRIVDVTSFRVYRD